MKIRHRVFEETVKDDLIEKGFARSSIDFTHFDLVAIERPGWVQIYKFVVSARKLNEPEATLMHGLLRDDERAATEIHVFDSIKECDKTLLNLQRGMIVKTNTSISRVQAWLLGLFVIILLLAMASEVTKAVVNN